MLPVEFSKSTNIMKGNLFKEIIFCWKSQTFLPVVLTCLTILAGAISVYSQSINPEFPTGVSTNQLNGIIKPRDLGDARLTSYYYTFNGEQGDIFINIAAKNLIGDIDIYYAEGLRPLTKISFYGDDSQTETGRVIYLRKSEKIILRVQGRTPDENPAQFQIKFAGSFVAVADTSDQQPDTPIVKNEDTSGVRVNSVGTIIKSEPVSETKETIAEKNKNADEKTSPTSTENASDNPPKVIVTDAVNEQPTTETNKVEDTGKTKETPAKSATTNRRRATPRNTRRAAARTAATTKDTVIAEPKEKTSETAETANPLENVHLTVLLKNGEKLEFPMTEVFRFSMNNNVLTIITKDGKIYRKPIVEVQKMSVE